MVRKIRCVTQMEIHKKLKNKNLINGKIDAL